MQQSTRRPLVAGNWKMNGDLELAKQVMAAVSNASISGVNVVVCPPFPYLAAFASSECQLGAQNLSHLEKGAHTGEVSARMLREVGCQYVIVGHSERRTDNHENDDCIAEKVQTALNSGLTPILCIGETLEERQANNVEAVLSAQLQAVIDCVGITGFSQIVVAYEPIWAIGTGVTATPEQAQDTHAFIREYVAEQDKSIADELILLYGGSVKATNAKALFAQADIDGGLIGGASLDPESFVNVCLAAK